MTNWWSVSLLLCDTHLLLMQPHAFVPLRSPSLFNFLLLRHCWLILSLRTRVWCLALVGRMSRLSDFKLLSLLDLFYKTPVDHFLHFHMIRKKHATSLYLVQSYTTCLRCHVFLLYLFTTFWSHGRVLLLSSNHANKALFCILVSDSLALCPSHIKHLSITIHSKFLT